MKNILLVSPHSENEALWVTGEEVCGEVLNNFMPLGLATVAGLTGEEYHVDIWDELVHGVIQDGTRFRRQYDLVGVTGYKIHLRRCRELAALFRQRGIPVAIGGPGVSGSPDTYRGYFDHLFIGEVELTWPQFIKDWERGCAKVEYRQIDKPDLSASPLPRWDSILDVVDRYSMGCVQTTRGCPFDCEFCDVIYIYGRRSRHKPIANVLEEVRRMEQMGKDNVFFCDDEFIGDPRYAKDLLRELIQLNNSFRQPLTFSTQLTMNLSKDQELLELMADANFNLIFIGIETPNPESLQETGKFQNVRKDLVADIHKILSYGIAIRSGLIVGFDHDGLDIFDIQYDFIQKACLQSLGVNMLKAPLETKLYTRLRREGRVVDLSKVYTGLGPSRSYTNILPKLMSRVELLEGFQQLLRRTHSWDSFRDRIFGFVSLVKRRPNVREPVLAAEEARRICLSEPGLSPEGRSAIEAIIDHTERTAPFMLRRVKVIIVQYCRYLTTLAKLYSHLDRQTELERTNAFPLELDARPVPISDGFRDEFNKFFPQVYSRVYVNLTDPSRVPAALTEVFVDFLVSWGKDFEGFEAHHLVYLNEISDRTCAQFNGQPPQEFVARPVGDTQLPNIKRTRLAEDVLTTVAQELLKLTLPAKDGEQRRQASTH